VGNSNALDIGKLKLRAHRIFGGITPPPFKASSLRSRIMPSPLPKMLYLSLQQHQGAAISPVVKVGDSVLKYQLLANGYEDSCVGVHAPTSGKVIAIESYPTPDLLQNEHLCIQLQADNKDQAISLEAIADYRALSNTDLLAKVRQAGICGLGGAGFPTALKLERSIEAGTELLIINAAECEPYITADESLLREFAEQVVSGAEILQKICLAGRCVIAIEKNKTDAIKSLKTALLNSSIELIKLPAKYPTGGEKQIIQGVTGLEVPSGEYPSNSGILVQNTGTANAVHKAVVNGEPCVSRITTLTGSPLKTPKNFEALIGTPISFLFDVCGIDNAQFSGAIVGGSIMGIELPNVDSAITKTTNCIIAKSPTEFPGAEAENERACIRCGHCAEVCPAKLLPQQLYAHSRNRSQEELLSHGLSDCIECGACAYVCPSNIPLVQYYRASKQDLVAQYQQEAQSSNWQNRFQTHQYRLKKNQEDKLSKRAPEKPKPNTDDEKKFSRKKAREEIADAVKRVQARKQNVIASSKKK
jgi:Na+-translocating ferredoxin:NAD+ oxidoreductase subunit C